LKTVFGIRNTEGQGKAEGIRIYILNLKKMIGLRLYQKYKTGAIKIQAQKWAKNTDMKGR